MDKELYNWRQLKAYAIIALHNVRSKNIEVNYTNFIRELDTLQTMYGKDGVIGLANRYLNFEKDSD